MKCRICGNTNTEVLTKSLRRGNGTVYYCPDCDYGMLEPCFNDAKEYYNGEYRKKFKDVLDDAKETPQEIYEMRKDYQADRLKLILPFCDVEKSFLEIGSSAGQFLMQIAGKFGEISGIELDSSCAEFSRVLLKNKLGVEPEIYTQSIEFIQWKKREEFDYIGFFQVLEHVADPEAFLKSVYDCLADGGRVFIEVPNLYDPLRSLWYVPAYEEFYYHEAHLSYFSKVSLEKLLFKCGYELEKIYFIQDYNLLNNLYWYYMNGPQKNCKFGLDKPRIEFKDKEAGDRVNRILEQANEEYFKVLSEFGLTANIFAVARKRK